MDKSKKGKKSRQEKSMDDDSVGDVEERKPARNSTGKTSNDRQVETDSEESDTEWKKPSKLAKNTAGGKNKKQPANSDEESGDSDNEKKVTAKQSKSNTKKKNKKESREEEVIKETPKADVNDVKSNQKKDKKGAAKNSLKKKQEESDDDDDVDDDEVIVTKKGAQMKPTFQMLAMESSEDEKEDEEDSDASIEVKKPETVNQKKGKKAKQDKKKVKPAEDEDIDKLVAEISNMSQKKKGDKKKEPAVKEETSDNHVIEAKPEVTVTSEMTQEELYKLMDEMAVDDDDDTKVRKKKGKQQVTAKKQESVEHEEGKEGGSDQEDDGDDASTVKSAAQKKKEKKERQKAEKQKKTEVKGKEKAPAAKEEKDGTVKAHESKKEELEKEQDEKVEDKKNELKNEGETEDQPAEEHSKELGEAEEAKGSKKDKKKKKDDKDKDKDKAKKPSKMVQEILERQKRLKEEEERLQREEEERTQREEEAIRLKEEEERRIKERKEKEKQKKKDKIERKKQEGTFLTEKQKADKRRLAQMLEVYQKDIPDEARAAATEKKPPRYEKKKPKQNRQVSVEGKDNGSAVTSPIDDTQVEPSLTEAEKPEAEKPESEKPESAESKEEETDEVKEAWDISSAEEEEDEEEEEAENKPVEKSADKKDASVKEAAKREERSKSEEPASEEEEKTSEEEEDSDESEESSSEDDDRTPQEKAREKALARIQKRKEEAEAKRTVDRLRAPVVCVLGHVDTGKTKILDKLRRTNVQDGEAGGITQQIGATNVPQETIREQTKMCKEFQKQELKLPGLLIIDTPGHESFSNLRNRGSSLCDIAILVVDIMHGLEPQTIESMNLLKSRKTPFVVALNKVDRLYGWQTNPHSDIINTLNRQKPNTKMEFNDRTKEVIVQFAEQGLNATLFHENKNPREYISLVPTSAHTGDGMGSLIALLCDLTQNMLAKRLMFSEELKATVMEVKALPGLGTTIDVILVNGTIHEGDTIVVAGQEGPIVTQIRALLMPQPLRELRVKSQYEHHKEVLAAQGCKIIAKDLEKALAGLPLYVATEPDEAEIYKEELSQMLKDVLGDVKVSDKGVYVQASTLGSLEALLQFLKTSEIPFAGINIGPVHRKDIMKASVMLEHDQQYAVILAFDVKVEHEAQTMADSLGVRIFTADIIYHLFDSFTKYREDFKKQKREEFKHIAVFPCKMRIMPQYIFNSRDPIVVGVIIEAGFLKEGTLLCVPSKEFVEIGRVSSIEVNHKTVERATKGQEVCIKIDPIPGEAPKMYGRHFEATDSLVSKISRQSIDAVKNYFREEMSKNDWQLIMELKKIFEIL